MSLQLATIGDHNVIISLHEFQNLQNQIRQLSDDKMTLTGALKNSYTHREVEELKQKYDTKILDFETKNSSLLQKNIELQKEVNDLKLKYEMLIKNIETNKMEQKRKIILSDFYREENLRIEMILRSEKFKDYKIDKVNNLNKIIGTYKVYKSWENHYNPPPNVNQFVNILLPNIKEWFPNWN